MASSWAASAFRWWQESGVDTLVGEEPRDWLNPAADAPAVAAAPVPEPAQAPLPGDLDGLRDWLLTGDDVPLARPGTKRVGPAGDPGAGLMVLVDMPSAADVAAGTLLSGEAGALFDRMLKAMERSRSAIYLASLSPVRTATGMLPDGATARLADIARHHIGLVEPRAVLLFGDACAKALLGLPVLKARGRWHEIATAGRSVRALATIRPEKLLGQPTLKKHVWDDLQLLMEGLKP